MPQWIGIGLGAFNVVIAAVIITLGIRSGRKWKRAHASTVRAIDMANERSAQAQSRMQVYYAARYYVAGLSDLDALTAPSDLITLIEAVRATDELEEQHVLARRQRRGE